MARSARTLPALLDLSSPLPALDRGGTLDEILRALAEDLKDRGGLDLSECFVDGTFVGAKKGKIRGKDQARQRHQAYGGGRRFWSPPRRMRSERFSARSHARRSDARGELLLDEINLSA